MDIVPCEVVVSGIGGYFPKAINVEEFKERLLSNESLLSQRFNENDLQSASGLVGCIDSNLFDNSYFGIHKQQCFYMDPMHRLALERTFEALADAGVSLAEVKGKRIGVFMGSTIGENDHLFMESVVSGFGVTGHSRAMLANRISYWLNLKGPSVAYDCNWVTGVEILRLAYCAIKTGQCDSVIIGTTNLAMHSQYHAMYEEMGLLSTDGSTKAFDADAKGYARSEGVVILYIQRSTDARRQYASVVNVATRFDGTTSDKFLSIDEDNMVKFLEEFYEKCEVKSNDVEFVEAYGCGLKEIDKRELNALERVYCKNRPKPLSVGSIKTITGHAEASSALFSIVKTLLAMETETIPATLQYTTPNPEIKGLLNGNLEVLTTNKKWEPTFAAVNALGTSSYFGHVVFKANPKKKVLKKINFPVLLNVSTRTEEGINKIMETLQKKPHDPEFYNLTQQFFSRSIQGHLYRGYILLGNEQPKQEIMNYMGNKRQIWFVYSGMGSQWNNMLGDLMQIDVFAESINKSCEILSKKGVDLMKILTSEDKTIFDNILHCFVGIAAMQIALTDVLRALGIEPDGIIGHSVGELGCAYADGCMTHEQMILSSYSRGRASLEATLIKGMMAAIGLGYNQIKNSIPETIEVACHNAADSCTISGPEEDMEKYVKALSSQGTFAKLVNVANIAYHSRYIKPAAPLLLKYLKEVLPTPMPRSSKWISTSNLESNWDTDLAKNSSAEYHTNNLLSSVLFEEGIKHIPKDSVLIEIAPHGLLQAILKRAVKESINVPLTRRGAPSGTEFLLQSFGKLYLNGVDMNLSKIYPKIEYPVSRNTPSCSDLVHWNHADNWSRYEDSQKSKKGVRNVDVTLSSTEFLECNGHKIHGKAVFPISQFLNIILQISDSDTTSGVIIFENLHFKKSLIIPSAGSIPLNAMIQLGSGEFEFFSDNDQILTGKMTVLENEEDVSLQEVKVELNQENVKLNDDDVYGELEHRGYKYSGAFKNIKNLTLTLDGSVGRAQWDNRWLTLVEAMIQQQLFNEGERNQESRIPKRIQKIIVVYNGLPKNETEVDVNFEYDTRILSAPGIEITDIETVPFDQKSQDIRICKMDFVQLDNSVLNNMAAGIEQALLLCMANFNQQNVTKVYVSELITSDSLQDHIKEVIKDYTMYYINYTSVKELKHITVTDSFPQLIILNDIINKDVIRLLNQSSTSFLLAKVDRTQQLDPKLSRVAYFRIGQDHYIICRKATTVKPKIINVKENTVSFRDVQKKSTPWVSELLRTSEECAKTALPIMLVISTVPAEGFNHFYEKIKASPNMQNIRIFYNLDKNSDKLNEAIRRDISLVVLKDGQWFSHLPLSVNIQKNKISERPSTTPILDNKTISYLGVNLVDETLNVESKCEIGNIDYCGVAKNGQRVMGLGYLDTENSKLIVDNKLTWEVPSNWNLESAVTVPNAYVCAYYMLVIKARVKHGETVLIHSGCSAIGLAAISIAYSYGCQIFVTVASERQRAYLKKQFDFLQLRNILDFNTSKFENDLLFATGAKGAEVVLNCVSGSLLKSSFQCIAAYGRFIQYGKYDMEEGTSIGMFKFLYNVSLHCVDLQNIFFLDNEIKEEIHQLIEDGIKKYVVRTLRRVVLKPDEIKDVIKVLQDPETIGKVIIQTGNTMNINKINFKDPSRFICNSQSSYLILGGSATNWAYVTEWLVHRGARKIVIASDHKPKENQLNRRLQILQEYYGATLIIGSSKIQTKQHASQLLAEVGKLGKPHVVFTLPQQSNSTGHDDSVDIFESVLKDVAPEAILVNFDDSAAGVCYRRSSSDFQTYNIIPTNGEDLRDAIFGLDAILNSNLSNVLLSRDNEETSTQEMFKAVIKDVTKLVPSLDDILHLQKNTSNEPELVQVLTEGPIEIRELAPLFLIPGLTGFTETEEMLKNLLYPTFCAVLPANPWPWEKLADVYAQKMFEVYPKGVFNIVSTSSGGALAIEIAKQLTKRNARLNLFFVDSSPLRIQQGLQDLGNGVQFEINLLRVIFEINDSEIVTKLNNCPNFESRMNLLLGLREDKTEKKISVLQKGLVNIKDYIEKIKVYAPDGNLVPGIVHVLVPSDCSPYDSYGLSSYFKALPLISQFGGDHLSIINNYDAGEYINKNHKQY
ncbi:fatty acid synthase-like [Diorhabda carinulata]|uniref:fatty acid synthase-like n=1 Tax=Diorhabda carinulata TaxID=1163345 RepID=UPI0025A2BDE7|nr:fatty acid synthase-like [Diorhabda carinulata]